MALMLGAHDGRGHGRERQPQAAGKAAGSADGKCHDGFGQRHQQVLVDVGVGEEPVADHAEDLDQLAEEEGRLLVVVEHHRRDQPRLGHHVPEHEQQHQQAELP